MLEGFVSGALLLELGVELDEAIADAVYVGVATDTGCFRYANTTAHTFDAAADCLAAGARVFDWNLKLFETVSLSKLRLQGWMAEHTRLYAGGKLALCALPKAVEQELGVDEDELGNLCAFLRSIKGVCMAALLREVDERNTKVSVRALPGYNAAAVCERFEGGGHAGAAGCSVRQPLQEAAEVFAKAMLEWENGG